MKTGRIETGLTTEPLIGKRFLAGLVDYWIIYGFFFIYGYYFGQPDNEGGFTINGLSVLGPILFWGLMTVGLEQLSGATLGNGLFGLKPISINKETNGTNWTNYLDRPTFEQSLKRHLLDPVDMFFFGLIGIITIKNTEMNQRVGDLWAKTIVIKKRSNGK